MQACTLYSGIGDGGYLNAKIEPSTPSRSLRLLSSPLLLCMHGMVYVLLLICCSLLPSMHGFHPVLWLSLYEA